MADLFSIDEGDQERIGNGLPVIALAKVLIDKGLISHTELRDAALVMLRDVERVVDPECPTKVLGYATERLVRGLSGYDPPSPSGEKPNWLRGVIEGGAKDPGK